MHRKLLVAALAAFLPALALAAPPQEPTGALPHPAASAHATAAAGQADAGRIEACTAKANQLIDDLEKGDTKAATSNFNATMKEDLDANKLRTIWHEVGQQMGNLQSRGKPQNMMYRNHALVTLPLHFTKAAANAQVACDAEGKIAGFFLRPATPPPGTQ